MSMLYLVEETEQLELLLAQHESRMTLVGKIHLANNRLDLECEQSNSHTEANRNHFSKPLFIVNLQAILFHSSG